MADTSRRTEAGSAASPWRWEQVPEPQERPVSLTTTRVPRAPPRRARLRGVPLDPRPPDHRDRNRDRRPCGYDHLDHVACVCTYRGQGHAFVAAHRSRALTFLVLGAIELVVFTPIAFALKLLRRDPLAAGSQPSDLTFWHQNPTVGRRSLHRRQFTYEPRPARAKGFNARLPLASLRAALGLVVVVILFDVVLGAAYNVVFDRGGNAPSGAHIAQLGAWANEPWAAELRKEIASSSSRLIPQPFRGLTFPDYSGRYVHVKNGVRSSYEPRPAGKDPTNVFFFGGSTMFGTYQRDQHTIPSEFARLAEADRRAVRVVNYGVIGYGIWQEVELLEERLTKGDIPDVVIFYDGANEQFIQAREGPVATPSHLYANTCNWRRPVPKTADAPRRDVRLVGTQKRGPSALRWDQVALHKQQPADVQSPCRIPPGTSTVGTRSNGRRGAPNGERTPLRSINGPWKSCSTLRQPTASAPNSSGNLCCIRNPSSTVNKTH